MLKSDDIDVSELRQKLGNVRDLLKANGCDCVYSCGHEAEEDHHEGCERCLACRIEEAIR